MTETIYLVSFAGGSLLGMWLVLAISDQLDRAHWSGRRFEWGPIVFGPVLAIALWCGGVIALAAGVS